MHRRYVGCCTLHVGYTGAMWDVATSVMDSIASMGRCFRLYRSSYSHRVGCPGTMWDVSISMRTVTSSVWAVANSM